MSMKPCSICGRLVDDRHRHVVLAISAIEENAADHDGPLTPPKEFRVFAAGANASTKGDFLFDEKAVEQVTANAAAWANRYPFDFNHAMVRPAESNDPAEEKKAAGQFTPEIRNGELWATAIRWTPYARSKLEAGEYTYFSPAFTVDEDERVVELTNVALTNLPAMHGIPQLVAASRDSKTQSTPRRARPSRGMIMTKDELKEAIHAKHEKIHGEMYDEEMRAKCDEKLDAMKMDDLKGYHDKLAKAFPPAKGEGEGEGEAPDHKEPDGDEAEAKADKKAADDDDAEAEAKAHSRSKPSADVAILTKMVASLKGQVENLTKKQDTDERSAILDRGKREGRLSPADLAGETDLGKSIKKLSVDVLRDLVPSLPARVSTSETTRGDAANAAEGRTFQVELEKGSKTTVVLSKADLAIAKKLGNDPADVAKQRAKEIARAKLRADLADA